MNKLFNWINTYPDNAKVFVGTFLMMTLMYLLLFIGLWADGVTPGQFLSKANAGTGGQIVFWVFAALYAICIFKTVFTKRVR